MTRLLLFALSLVFFSACSVRTIAVRSLGSAMAGGGGAYARDDDPELVGAALPFGLKTIEGLLEADPANRNLLLAAASGFTQYATAYVLWEADYTESHDAARAAELRERGRKLLLRALDYGRRGLEAAHPGLAVKLHGNGDADPAVALRVTAREDVPFLYWTAAAWGTSISRKKDDPELAADLPIVEALLRRAVELDEGWGTGAIHDALMLFEGGRPAAAGGSVERARNHFDRAVGLSRGGRAAPLVSFAESISVGSQNRKEFESLLRRALAIDLDAFPDQRLANALAQKRARWLLGRIGDLFLEE